MSPTTLIVIVLLAAIVAAAIWDYRRLCRCDALRRPPHPPSTARDWLDLPESWEGAEKGRREVAASGAMSTTRKGA